MSPVRSFPRTAVSYCSDLYPAEYVIGFGNNTGAFLKYKLSDGVVVIRHDPTIYSRRYMQMSAVYSGIA